MDKARTDLGTELQRYYYHPDHLGSASWITNRNGQSVQHMQYLPYGETKLDQRIGSYHERFTFSGKEKDSETGYHYFGARYYNSDLSLWLSVDPMSDKYPSLSPYNYCAWNPMKIVDPNGEEIVLPSNKRYAQKIVKDLNTIYRAIYKTSSSTFALEEVKDSKGKIYNRLSANDDFNWQIDKYSKAMKESIDDPVKVKIKFVRNRYPDEIALSRGRKVNSFIDDLGGGYIKGNNIFISEDLTEYSTENMTKGKFAKRPCIGGIVMHEILYHLHSVGVRDAKENPINGAAPMQQYYMLKRSKPHGPGNQHVFPSKRK